MAVEFYLICNECKEFIDLYKIRLLTGAPHPLPVEGIVVTKTDLETAIHNFKKKLFRSITSVDRGPDPFY